MNGRVSFVTGTSSGFGWHIALELARRGDWVFAGMQYPSGRDAARAAEMAAIAEREGRRITVVEVDVDFDDSVTAAIAAVVAAGGRIDVVVNNAGFGVMGPWELTTIDQVRRQLETNFLGVFRVSKAAVPHMRRQGAGWIVNVSSEAGLSAVPLEAFYTASKFALEGMSQTMRYELSQFGIRVSVVNPGAFRESMFDARIIDVAREHGAGIYEPLVRHMADQFERKWTTYVSGEQMARVVADAVDDDDPPYRVLANASEWRVRPRPVDEYEVEMAAFFEIGPFLKPWKRGSRSDRQ